MTWEMGEPGENFEQLELSPFGSKIRLNDKRTLTTLARLGRDARQDGGRAANDIFHPIR
jgi:hypothetical protein